MSKYNVTQSGSGTGTSLQGYLVATYDELVHAFGPPTYDDTSGDGKVDVEWVLNVENTETGENTTVTIYNWKDYDGGALATSGGIYQWHVGGYDGIAEFAITQALEEALAEKVL